MRYLFAFACSIATAALVFPAGWAASRAVTAWVATYDGAGIPLSFSQRLLIFTTEWYVRLLPLIVLAWPLVSASFMAVAYLTRPRRSGVEAPRAAALERVRLLGAWLLINGVSVALMALAVVLPWIAQHTTALIIVAAVAFAGLTVSYWAAVVYAANLQEHMRQSGHSRWGRNAVALGSVAWLFLTEAAILLPALIFITARRKLSQGAALRLKSGET